MYNNIRCNNSVATYEGNTNLDDIIMVNTPIQGLSHGKSYIIEGLKSSLSRNIYIAHDKMGNKYAIKISKNRSYIYNEYKLFNKLKKFEFIPLVFDLDQVILYNTLYHYIVMEFVESLSLNDIVKKGYDCDKASLVCRDIASIFLCLKQNGIYYTNLVLENIVFDVNKKKLMIINFDGISYRKSEVVDFMPPFDRTSWGIGLRIADSGYLSFEVGMLFVFIVIGHVVDPKDKDIADVLAIANSDLGGYYLPIMKALNGTYKLSKLIEDFDNTYFNEKISNTLNYTLIITGIIFIILLKIAM